MDYYINNDASARTDLPCYDWSLRTLPAQLQVMVHAYKEVDDGWQMIHECVTARPAEVCQCGRYKLIWQ